MSLKTKSYYIQDKVWCHLEQGLMSLRSNYDFIQDKVWCHLEQGLMSLRSNYDFIQDKVWCHLEQGLKVLFYTGQKELFTVEFRGYKTFSVLNSAEQEISTAHKKLK